MYCARELCPELKHGFRLLLGSGEETGCKDIEQYLSKNDPPPNVFAPDADFPLVNVEKGRFVPVFNASWSEEHALPRVLSITGGKTTNVVPDRAEAVVEGISKDEAEPFCREYSAKTGTRLSAREHGAKLIITAEGKAAHAAMSFNGNNAQTALTAMLGAMPFADGTGQDYIRALGRLFPHGDCHGGAFGIAMSDEVSGELTINFGVLAYTVTDLTGNFDSRTPACADSVDLVEITRDKLQSEGLQMTYSDISRCHHTAESTPFVQTLLKLYEEYTGNPGECLIMGGSTYVHEIPGGVAFGCNMPGVDNKIHSSNEFISIDHLVMSAKMFAMAIIDMCG
jgi:succinyl-diaminopimelate desuccinylase